MHFLGNQEYWVRLPSLVSVLVAVICCYWFVQRRMGASISAIAILFLLSSNAAAYAYDARPYALLIGSCGVLLMSWQPFIWESAHGGTGCCWR